MKKFIYALSFLGILFMSASLNAQYRLQNAFPNLPVFSNAIELVNSGDGTNRLFVAQQRGIIYVFNNSPAVSSRKTFINLSSKVSQSGSETGLLGLTFHPNYENNGYFYVNYTFDSAGVLWSRIARYTSSQSNPDTAFQSTQQILITLFQPFSNHNGGKVAFGPDGYLYISFGDGGSGGDPFNNGQTRSVLLGKILRINVDSSSNGNNYSIPPTNPYFENGLGYRQEIYAYGLRNVWKFSFDFPTNRLYAGDVGQNNYEEISIIENGKNYGWNKMEGFHCYGTCDTAGMGFTRPIYEYNHDTGNSITGGAVYRGAWLPELYGKYIYADYIDGKIWALGYDGINPTTNQRLLDTSYFLSAFGVDENNELYVTSLSGSSRIFRISNTSIITLNLKLAIQGFYNLNNNTLNISDTVKVYLHQSVAPYNIVDSSKTVIDSLSLSGVCIFNNAPTGKYYIKVTHRNGLETWSRSGGDSLRKGNIVNYDFTTSASQAFGSNQILKGTVYCIYSGDVNQDGIIDINDLGLIDNDLFGFVNGYQATDLNGDGFVDLSDMQIADNNARNVVMVLRPL
ncbi:MAG: PQQ-dependent sugar dehydrogenase [Bacteroidota bacterium]|nr:PQQ-dependent sugar dehydrogenase [Bacteroidota bacterium]